MRCAPNPEDSSSEKWQQRSTARVDLIKYFSLHDSAGTHRPRHGIEMSTANRDLKPFKTSWSFKERIVSCQITHHKQTIREGSRQQVQVHGSYEGENHWVYSRCIFGMREASSLDPSLKKLSSSHAITLLLTWRMREQWDRRKQECIRAKTCRV